MTTIHDTGQFNGAVLVAENGKVIYQKGFGKANIEKQIAFTPDTSVYLASLTKQFTAMAIMILVEQHKLSYDDTLSKYFPEFPPYAQKITIRNLLNHTSGIPDYPQFGLERPGLTNQDVLNTLIKQQSLRFAPGEKFDYSNSGYILLAMIIERVSKQPNRLFLKNKIFQPLGMKSTFVYDKSASLPEKRARGYSRFGEDDDYTLLTFGEGGIYSTVKDLYQWDKSLYTEKLVKQSTLMEAFTPAKLNDGRVSNYGFGFGIATYNGEPTASHAGRFGGFNTYIKRFLKNRSAIIFLTNSGFKNMSAIGNALINILHNKPYELPKLSVADAMYKKYRSTGITSALQFYDSIKKDNDAAYDVGIAELDELGYQLLRMSKTQDAIEIFKLNVAAYPNSSSLYDSLGEAYMKNGDKKLAIKHYQKSVELNPQNTNGIEMLKKLREQ